MKRTLKSKRGFTIAETVISLAVVIIISVGTMSLLNTSTKSLRRATHNAQAQNFVADVVSCYRVAETDEELVKSIIFATQKSDGTVLEVKIGEPFMLHSHYMALITIEGNTITAQVTNGDKEIAKATFTKGGA